MAQNRHPTFVVALTIVLATALAASSFAQSAGRGNSPGGSPGGPGRGGPGMETYYTGNDNCVGDRCNPQRKPKVEHSDHCSPTVTNGQPAQQDCHPVTTPKP